MCEEYLTGLAGIGRAPAMPSSRIIPPALGTWCAGRTLRCVWIKPVWRS